MRRLLIGLVAGIALLGAAAPSSAHATAPPTTPGDAAVDASDDAAPTTMDGWGAPIAPKSFAAEAGTVTVPVDAPARHLYVAMIEAGKDASCSTNFPYRGRIAEVSFASATGGA